MNADKSLIEIRRRFPAAPERVFGALSDAELVARWLYPSPEIALTLLRFDFRVGRAYRFAYHFQDQQTVFVGGFYIWIERPSKIVFSWIIEPPDEHAGIESEVTVTITRLDRGTELVIRHTKFALPDAIVRHTEGWSGALSQLAAVLGRGGSTWRSTASLMQACELVLRALDRSVKSRCSEAPVSC